MSPTKKDDSDGGDSSGEEGGPNIRRALLDEFRKRHGYNIPLHQQVYGGTCRKMTKQHASRSRPVMKLSEVVAILGEQKWGATDKQVTTVGWELKIRRAKINSSFPLSGPCFST